MLTESFKQHFGDIAVKSSHYNQGLAYHTALRILGIRYATRQYESQSPRREVKP
jgi:hypothetical protein